MMTDTILPLAAALAVGLLLASPAQAQTPAPATPAPMTGIKKMGKEPSAGMLAARERQKTCSTEWKAAKEGGKLAAGTKWPKFWSECNTRLKGKTV
jgi:hypothetical protein